MITDGALLRGLQTVLGVAAVQTHPAGLYLRDEQGPAFQLIRQQAETLAVELFNGGNLPEGGGGLREALLGRDGGEGGVYGTMFLVLIVLGGAQQLQDPVGALNGVSAVDRQILTVQGLQMVPENLGVGLFLLGCGLEDKGHRL